VPVHLTPRAADRVRTLLADKGLPDGWLRLGVKGGGCSGFSYVLDLVAAAAERDRRFEEHGARICVDLKSYLFVNGTTVDWRDDLVKEGFVFDNPTAKKSCSCGDSFAV
jgi:iron-sulfur cluster assembly protein